MSNFDGEVERKTVPVDFDVGLDGNYYRVVLDVPAEALGVPAGYTIKWLRVTPERRVVIEYGQSQAQAQS